MKQHVWRYGETPPKAGVKIGDLGTELSSRGDSYYVYLLTSPLAKPFWFKTHGPLETESNMSNWFEEKHVIKHESEYKVKLGYPKKGDWYIATNRIIQARVNTPTNAEGNLRYILQEPYADPKKVRKMIETARRFGLYLSWPNAQALINEMEE